jgi:hypothetical protein
MGNFGIRLGTWDCINIATFVESEHREFLLSKQLMVRHNPNVLADTGKGKIMIRSSRRTLCGASIKGETVDGGEDFKVDAVNLLPAIFDKVYKDVNHVLDDDEYYTKENDDDGRHPKVEKWLERDADDKNDYT